MTVYPAIDIQDGRVLRLAERTPRGQWNTLPDPVQQAEAFLEGGAAWLHVVDMDRALGTGKANNDWIRAICALPNAKVQVGGNVSSARWAADAVEAGATRIVIGTGAALSEEFEHLLSLIGIERAAVNIDVRQGSICVRERERVAGGITPPNVLARRALSAGVTTVVYRDLDRDGLATGADLVGAERLAREGVAVIVAGGVAGLHELTEAAERGLAGVIVGRALYDRRFTLREANACLR